MRDKITCKADVITCASPNMHALQKNKEYIKQPEDAIRRRNNEVMRRRIEFIRDVMETEDVEIAILGAYGGGVFRQDPEMGATPFKQVLTDSNMECVYAVKPGFHMENVEAFRKIFA